MSTGAIIAVKNKDNENFRGVEVHWDGDPSGVGRTLFDLTHGPYRDRLDEMMQIIVFGHNGVYWSDFALWDGNPVKIISSTTQSHIEQHARQLGLTIEQQLGLWQGFASVAQPDRVYRPVFVPITMDTIKTYRGFLYIIDTESGIMTVSDIEYHGPINHLATIDLVGDTTWPDWDRGEKHKPFH